MDHGLFPARFPGPKRYRHHSPTESSAQAPLDPCTQISEDLLIVVVPSFHSFPSERRFPFGWRSSTRPLDPS